MLGQDIAAALPALRAQAESLMVESCDIDRLTTTWDEVTQKSVTTWAPVHAGIPCALDMPPTSSRVLLADEAVTPDHPTVKIPVAYDGIEPDDRVTVTGRGVMWVTHVPTYSNAVQTRLECRWSR